MTSEIFVQKTKPFYNYLTNLNIKKKIFFFFFQNFEPWTLVTGIRYSTLYATENIIILIQNCHGWSKNFFYLFSEITCNGEKIERNFFLTPLHPKNSHSLSIILALTWIYLTKYKTMRPTQTVVTLSSFDRI